MLVELIVKKSVKFLAEDPYPHLNTHLDHIRDREQVTGSRGAGRMK